MIPRGQRRLNSSKEEGRRGEALVVHCNHSKSTDSGGGCDEDLDGMTSVSCCRRPEIGEDSADVEKEETILRAEEIGENMDEKRVFFVEKGRVSPRPIPKAASLRTIAFQSLYFASLQDSTQ